MTIITVSQLNNYIKRYVDCNDLLNRIYVKGEISNFKRHTSGHIYLTLKDEFSSVKCVMFSSDAVKLKFLPENGMKVVALGRVSVYERDGAYQLYINEIIPDGTGELYAAFEQLKNQLEAEGYFSDTRKKPIPKYPDKIGVVTASTGAAVQDIINICARRFPMTKIYVYSALVQGPGASKTIADGISYFNSQFITDVIIVGRGGGSIEDLWPFNERIVADAIYMSQVPVISAVGHETDYTIADFVADLRAPTPSAAAELAVPDCSQIMQYLNNSKSRCKFALDMCIKAKINQLDKFISKDISNLCLELINFKHQTIDSELDTLTDKFICITEKFANDFSQKCVKLDALSPLKVLARGYSVASKDNITIKSVNDVSKDDIVKLTFEDGCVETKII